MEEDGDVRAVLAARVLDPFLSAGLLHVSKVGNASVNIKSINELSPAFLGMAVVMNLDTVPEV
jgi:hypothetical protein